MKLNRLSGDDLVLSLNHGGMAQEWRSWYKKGDNFTNRKSIPETYLLFNRDFCFAIKFAMYKLRAFTCPEKNYVPEWVFFL